MERAHMDVVKDPARSSNNQNYEQRICRHLGRSDKCRRFDLETAIHDARIEFGTLPMLSHPGTDVGSDDEDSSPNNIEAHNQNQTNSSATLLSGICTVSNISQPRRILTNILNKQHVLYVTAIQTRHFLWEHSQLVLRQQFN